MICIIKPNTMRRCLLLASICMVAGGCASRGKPRIPTGEWSGKGSFTFERWGEPDHTAGHHRDYETWLRIRHGIVDAQPALEIEIISERGELPDLGPRTHLRVALVEVKKYDDGTVLYRVAGPIMDPKDEDRPRFESDTPPYGASLIPSRDGWVLQVSYMQGFVDVFRFRGRGLTKAGSLTVEDGSVHWVESLVQRKPADLISGRPPSNSLAGG